MYPLCEVGCHYIAHAGYEVRNMQPLLEAGLPYVKALTIVVRAAAVAGKLDGLPLPKMVWRSRSTTGHNDWLLLRICFCTADVCDGQSCACVAAVSWSALSPRWLAVRPRVRVLRHANGDVGRHGARGSGLCRRGRGPGRPVRELRPGVCNAACNAVSRGGCTHRCTPMWRRQSVQGVCAALPLPAGPSWKRWRRRSVTRKQN